MDGYTCRQELISSGVLSAVISMDGYHYSRAYLDTLENREEAYRRRGAPWTFDSGAILAFVREISTMLEWPDRGFFGSHV